MNERRVGLWLIGAFGGVATTVALGLAALKRGLKDSTSLVTALPLFDGLDLDELAQFVVGGHDVRRASYALAVREFQQRANVFDQGMVESCLPDLESWTGHVRTGTVQSAGATIGRLADLPEAHRPDTPRTAIERIQQDLRGFQQAHKLSQVVVINVASTEPPFAIDERHESLDRLLPHLETRDPPVLPASALYAWAALDLGLPYIN